MSERYSNRLIVLGFVLFLIGLLTGFVVPVMTNPRMALASHLEGLMNGMFLVVLGLVGTRVRLGSTAEAVLFWLALYGTFANWLATFLAAWWGAGSSMMPIAAGTFTGTPLREGLINLLLLSLSVAVVIVVGLVLWGLRRAT